MCRVRAAELLEWAAKVVNIRAASMDLSKPRLALFLDPRYMKAAFTEASWPGLVETVSRM
jgi:hypothetical protein